MSRQNSTYFFVDQKQMAVVELPIAGHPAYTISSNGVVKKDGVVRTPSLNQDGYAQTGIDGRTTGIHRLVA